MWPEFFWLLQNILSLTFVSAGKTSPVSLTVMVSVGVSGEINNGIKKEALGKDAARIWINDGIKMQNFSHSLVNIIWMHKCQRLAQNMFKRRTLWELAVSLGLCLQKPPGMKEEDEPEEEEEEELGHAETYAEYMPMKCKYDCQCQSADSFCFLISWVEMSKIWKTGNE